MAKVNWDNLYFFEDIEDLSSIFCNINFEGKFDPMNTLLKELDILADISYMFVDAKFDSVVINKPTSNSIYTCKGMFKNTVGNSVEFINFDFYELGEIDFGIDHMFERAVMRNIHIDNIDISNINSAVHWFYGAIIDKIQINNFTSYSSSDIRMMFSGASIHCDVDLSGLHGPIKSAISAFADCIIDSELNLSYMNFSMADVSGMFRDSRINVLNLVGTYLFDENNSSPYNIGFIFSGMEVNTLKIREKDMELLYVIQQRAKRIGKVVTV